MNKPVPMKSRPVALVVHRFEEYGHSYTCHHCGEVLRTVTFAQLNYCPYCGLIAEVKSWRCRAGNCGAKAVEP